MKELQRWELTIAPKHNGGQMVRRKDGGWTPYHDALAAMNSLQREVDACNRALESAEAREAELRARISRLEREVKELEGMVPKWTPVHVQVPPEDHSILLMNGLPFIGRKRDGYRGEPNQDMNTYRATCCGKIGPAVTHWMPLPAAPATKEPE